MVSQGFTFLQLSSCRSNISSQKLAFAERPPAPGAIVEVATEVFMAIIARERESRPLVIMAEGGVIKTNYRYLAACLGIHLLYKFRRLADAAWLCGCHHCPEDLGARLVFTGRRDCC